MKDILCPDCKHSINEHSRSCRHYDVINPATWDYCKCRMSAQDIANHDSAALREAAKNVIRQWNGLPKDIDQLRSFHMFGVESKIEQLAALLADDGQTKEG